MAYLKGRTLFFTTSPRTPLKMIPEIKLLNDCFVGEQWTSATQEEYTRRLAEQKEFEGTGSQKDMALSARDRVNRAPKSLGFVDLKPTIQITEAGKNFLCGKRTEEVLLRQLLKFQLPSPFHKTSRDFDGLFGVKPYLEILRLTYELGTLSFDELMIFGLQLTHYSKFDETVEKIKRFRRERAYTDISYKNFRGTYLEQEVEQIYQSDIIIGKTKTRESRDTSIKKFIQTKSSNMRDYADACFRYLRATGVVEISQRGHSLSITPEKKKDVEFLLRTVEREPVYVDDEAKYKGYLFDAALPVLYSDDITRLQHQIYAMQGQGVNLTNMTVEDLKEYLDEIIQSRKEAIISQEVEQLKQYKAFSDVMSVFDDIKGRMLYDAPLMLEWNTWRAMTMLDGGEIKANLRFDDNGQPMSTALGNMPDIVCDYGDFNLAVEVTMQTGQRQYEMEGEPVARHLAKLKEEAGKEAYCLFVAPKINPSCIAHFYALHKMNILYYGGYSVIVPMELEVFINLVTQSYQADYIPDASQIKELFQFSMDTANHSENEMEWYGKLKEKALHWLG